MAEEKLYTIPLKDVLKVPTPKRTNRAVKEIRKFLIKHTKVKNVKLDKSINESLWIKGSKNPPRSIKVKVSLEEDTLKVTLA